MKVYQIAKRKQEHAFHRLHVGFNFFTGHRQGLSLKRFNPGHRFFVGYPPEGVEPKITFYHGYERYDG